MSHAANECVRADECLIEGKLGERPLLPVAQEDERRPVKGMVE